MPKSRPPYSPEFRRQMVDLVHAGRDLEELGRAFASMGQSIRAGAAGLAGAERDELVRLRRENKQLRLERLDPRRVSSLSRAEAWFAGETGTIPSGSSDS
jgi:transposase